MAFDERNLAFGGECPSFSITGKFSDYPRISVQRGAVVSIGHVVYEDDEWIVLRPKGTVQYEFRKAEVEVYR